MRAFVRTAARGETLGVSIGPVLRELSADQRRRRRQSAREQMQKAPVKMIFPLMFLIMPALMIVLMYPAAYSVSHNLPGFCNPSRRDQARPGFHDRVNIASLR